MRVVSYNTRDFLDDRRAAARIAASLSPDVLCLQEAPRWLLGDQLRARFARESGLRYLGRARGSGGTAIFVAPGVRVLSTRTRRLPVRWPERTRGLSAATVATHDVAPLTVISVHLPLHPGRRLIHIRQTLAAFPAADRLVVAGDLNESVSGLVAASMARGRDLRPIGTSHPSFPARSPRRRIDVIAASPSVADFVDEDRPTTWSGAEPASASDHLPVWADVR